VIAQAEESTFLSPPQSFAAQIEKSTQFPFLLCCAASYEQPVQPAVRPAVHPSGLPGERVLPPYLFREHPKATFSPRLLVPAARNIFCTFVSEIS
jgi:hypothetical protein